MKIFDCFTFFNELDLLEIRLEFLAGDVHKFVIVEANLTHAGNGKPYFFADNRDRFEKWSDKIIYIPLELSKTGLVFSQDDKIYNPKNASWVLENQQREAIAQIKNLVDDRDLVIVSDLDEIPDLRKIKDIPLDTPKALSQRFHNYFFNCQNVGETSWWNGSVVCSGKTFRETGAQVLRDNRNEYPRIQNAGWHFSYLGGVQAIKTKLKSFSHTEFNREEFLDENHIIRSLERGEDVLKRKNAKYRFVSLRRYPTSLRQIIQKYPRYIRALPWHKKVGDVLASMID